MLAKLMQSAPGPIGLLPDDDFAVIRTGSKDATKFGVGPVQLPYWSLVTVPKE